MSGTSTTYAPVHAQVGVKPLSLWRYYLPSENMEGWALIVIGSDGFFAAVSDYGNYSYFWSHHGCKDVRQFFLRADRDWDYFLGKLSNRKLYDGKETAEGIRRAVCEARRCRARSKEWARREFDLVKDLEVEDHEQNFTRWHEETSLDDAREHFCTMPCPQAKAFVQKCLKRLIPLLEADLARDGLPAT